MSAKFKQVDEKRLGDDDRKELKKMFAKFTKAEHAVELAKDEVREFKAEMKKVSQELRAFIAELTEPSLINQVVDEDE